MTEVQIEIVNRYGHGKEIRKNPHRVIFPEYKVGQQTETANNACIPKHPGKDRLAMLSRRPHLNKPARGKQGDPNIANHFPRIDLDSKKISNRNIEERANTMKIVY
jgi:hypothetical protein